MNEGLPWLLEPSVETRGRTGRGGVPRGNGKVFLVAAFALVVVAMAASLSTGSWWIPHNDDWAFTRIAERFARTGDTSLTGWNNMSVVGQVFVLGPLGTNALARHVFVLAGALLFVVLLLGRPGTPWSLVGRFRAPRLVVSGPFLLPGDLLHDRSARGRPDALQLHGRSAVRATSVGRTPGRVAHGRALGGHHPGDSDRGARRGPRGACLDTSSAVSGAVGRVTGLVVGAGGTAWQAVSCSSRCGAAPPQRDEPGSPERNRGAASFRSSCCSSRCLSSRSPSCSCGRAGAGA